MSFSTRLHTSWQLLQRSLQVLRTNPKLVLFPLVSTSCSILLALFFFAPILVLVLGHPWSPDPRDWDGVAAILKRAFYFYGIVIYLVSLFVATFFNVAFYHEIMRALAGEPVSLASGLRFALSRLGSILMWSLLAGTVGLIIRAIEERLGWLGKIVMAFVGTVWSVAAVFAIPVIVRRGDTNPLAVLRDSARTLKNTWGESLAGFVGLSLGGVAFGLVSVFFGAAAFVLALVLHLDLAAFGVAGLWVLSMIAIGVVIGMATHVYRCALYVYASEGVVPEPYTAELMDAGWKIKKS